MNAKELVEALRRKRPLCYPDTCHDCPYGDGYGCDKHMLQQAADLIESLLAKLANEHDSIGCRCRRCFGNREGMYRKCAELEEQLAESQRREIEVDDIADFIIQSEDNIRIAMDAQDRRYLENIIISWRRGPQDGE